MNDIPQKPPTNGAGHAHASDDIFLTWLKSLTLLEYDREREAAASGLGIRVSVLDEIIRRMRTDANPHYDVDPRPPEYSDESLALRFSSKHPLTLRYVAAWGRWYIWTGVLWEPDATMHVFNLSRELCREASAEVNDPDVATAVASARTIAAVERLARADRTHATTTDEWDADPWLLNTPEATINLRTGNRYRHRPADKITKITAVSPSGDCPRWRKFLDDVTARDVPLQLYLQRVAGYCLTGVTVEHAMFFAYGTGGNGKGVFLNTITAIMAAYAAVANMDTFTSSNSDRHPTDIAMLRGARLVTAQETEEGRRWAESRIKAMTGGDPVTARFMRQDFFTFIPQFKLIGAGNHKPGLRNVDEAIRRRMNLLPFAVKIPVEQRDAQLQEKLRAEWPGILQWAIDGCAEWQEKGLLPPLSVTGATQDYLADEDATQLWLDECCDVAPQFYDTSGALFASWKSWAERTGEPVGSQKRFSQNLPTRGFEPTRIGHSKTRGFDGIRLKPHNYRPPEE